MNNQHASIMKSYKRGLAVLVVLAVVSLIVATFQVGHASTLALGSGYYVSASGSNANPGSITQPWQTVQFAVDHAHSGDVIYVRAGTYNEALKLSIAGQSGSLITLTSYNSESVTINGGANPAITGTASYWSVKGLTLISASDRTVRVNASGWYLGNNKITGPVYFWGSYNTVELNEIDGSKHTGNENGLMDDSINSHHNVFRHNTIHDFNERGIWTQWRTHDNTIEYNTVYNILGSNGMCIDLDGAYNVEYRHVVRGNTVRNCTNTGIELENVFDSVVERNVVTGAGLEGIQIITYTPCEVGGESGQYGNASDCRGVNTNIMVSQNVLYGNGNVGQIVSYQSAGVKVYNNTIYAGKSSGLYLNNDTNYAHDWEVVGNIFMNNPRSEISVVNTASLTRDEYNLFYHTVSNKAYQARSTNTYLTLAEYQSKTGKGDHSKETNPLFADAASYNFHLTSASPAIDASTNVGETIDFEGNPRPFGAGYDMGAYEYNSSSSPTAIPN
jgi:hypothetical protein